MNTSTQTIPAMKTLKNFTVDNAYSDILQAQETLEGVLWDEEPETKELKEAKSCLEQARRWVAGYIKIKAEKEAMVSYEKSLAHHKMYYDARKPKREDFASDIAWHTAFNKWAMDESMSAPNKPGYYRANND